MPYQHGEIIMDNGPDRCSCKFVPVYQIFDAIQTRTSIKCRSRWLRAPATKISRKYPANIDS